MKTRIAVGLVTLALPVAAQAEELSFSFGAVVTSEYVGTGVRYSDGVALQPFAELAFGGLYAGAYASNVDEDLTAATAEYGLFVGYRGEAGKFSYDAGLNYYLYDDAFPDVPVADYGELFLKGTLAATEALYLTAETYLAPEYDQTILSVGMDYYTPVEGLSVGAEFGWVDADYGDWDYWSLRTSYQASDNVGLSLEYHDSNVNEDLGFVNTDGLIVASMTFAFTSP